jgi:3-oxoacyl-[acyl-carrier protein] reductase
MTQDKRFSGKHVLITGAARGIGFEIARQFARAGAVLSILDFNRGMLGEATAELQLLGPGVHSYFTDVSDSGMVHDAVSAAEKVQPVDILINNAGIAFETPFLDISEKEWKQVLDINLTGMFYVAQAVCRKMAARKKGVVVNMASKNGLTAEFGYAHYNASKAGIILLTKTMALELAHLNIRVNAVCPGYISTPMSMEIDPPGFTENFVRQFIPMNRAGSVEDVAPLFLFLAGEDSGFITGQVIIADGGQMAGQNPGGELLAKLQTR